MEYIDNQKANSEKTARAMVLDAAKEIVCHDRNDQYGEPEDNFAVIAKLWEAYLTARCAGIDINGKACVDVGAKEVADMMILFKVGRAATALETSTDTYIDIAGYAACAAEADA